MKKSDITKEKILEAAEKEFSEKGIFGARVDEIAGRANVNKRMIYAYFTNKEGLYSAVLTRVYNLLSEREKQLFNSDKDCVSIIKSIINMYFCFLNENPNFIRILMWENLNNAKYIKNSNAIVLKSYALELASEVLQNGIDQGVFRGDINIDDVILSMNMFAFSYFSNMHTMSCIMNEDFSQESRIRQREEHIKDVIIKYIMK